MEKNQELFYKLVSQYGGCLAFGGLSTNMKNARRSASEISKNSGESINTIIEAAVDSYLKSN